MVIKHYLFFLFYYFTWMEFGTFSCGRQDPRTAPSVWWLGHCLCLTSTCQTCPSQSDAAWTNEDQETLVWSYFVCKHSPDWLSRLHFIPYFWECRRKDLQLPLWQIQVQQPRQIPLYGGTLLIKNDDQNSDFKLKTPNNCITLFMLHI